MTSRNPIYSALWFASVVLSTAGLFVLAGAQFLAAGTIIVYAGAIIVTFLFVIMLAQMEGKARSTTGAARAPGQRHASPASCSSGACSTPWDRSSRLFIPAAGLGRPDDELLVPRCSTSALTTGWATKNPGLERPRHDPAEDLAPDDAAGVPKPNVAGLGEVALHRLSGDR